MTIQDKIRGCMLGGAAGDALGYPVEFLSIQEINRRYGKNGITEYELRNGKALISDDTQMTMFTANGLLYALTRGYFNEIPENIEKYIYQAYLNWLDTQKGVKPAKNKKICWLCDVNELYDRRAPGNTCFSSLSRGKMGTPEMPINRSMGCGGIMRVAPIGLHKHFTAESAFDLACKSAAITHGHEMGYLPAGALAYIIHRIVFDDSDLKTAIRDCIGYMKPRFQSEQARDICFWMEQAIRLSGYKSDLENIFEYNLFDHYGDPGSGWTGSSALYISLYSAVSYAHDFDKAIECAVNHSGDSDSTGAITGNIVGAINGYDKIADKWKTDLELRDVILELADDLYKAYPSGEDDKAWIEKYANSCRVK